MATTTIPQKRFLPLTKARLFKKQNVSFMVPSFQLGYGVQKAYSHQAKRPYYHLLAHTLGIGPD